MASYCVVSGEGSPGSVSDVWVGWSPAVDRHSVWSCRSMSMGVEPRLAFIGCVFVGAVSLGDGWTAAMVDCDDDWSLVPDVVDGWVSRMVLIGSYFHVAAPYDGWPRIIDA